MCHLLIFQHGFCILTGKYESAVNSEKDSREGAYAACVKCETRFPLTLNSF